MEFCDSSNIPHIEWIGRLQPGHQCLSAGWLFRLHRSPQQQLDTIVWHVRFDRGNECPSNLLVYVLRTDWYCGGISFHQIPKRFWSKSRSSSNKTNGLLLRMSEEEADWLAGHVYVLKFAIWFWGHVSTNNEYSIVGKWKHNFYAFNFTEKNNGCGDFFLKAQILCL